MTEFIAPTGLPPADSHACCTPWSVFQDGSDAVIRAPMTATQGATDLPAGESRRKPPLQAVNAFIAKASGHTEYRIINESSE